MVEMIVSKLEKIIAIMPIIWAIYSYFDSRRKDQKAEEFKNYHNLIKKLVSGDGGKLYIDRQCAIIFELRNFERYHEISKRILMGLKNTRKTNEYYERLETEINLTIKYIENKFYL